MFKCILCPLLSKRKVEANGYVSLISYFTTTRQKLAVSYHCALNVVMSYLLSQICFGYYCYLFCYTANDYRQTTDKLQIFRFISKEKNM